MVVAIILAGGKGNRLAPLSNYIPKSLFPIHGTPIIQILIEEIKAAGIAEIYLVLREKSELIRSFCKAHRDFGVNLQYIFEDPMGIKRGMGSALAAAFPMLPTPLKHACVVMAGDTVYPPGYIAKFVEFHGMNKCDVTISVCELDNPAILPQKSFVEIDPQGNLQRIIEKPRLEEIHSNYTAAPLFLFEPVAFDYIHRIEPSPRGEYEFQTAIQLMIDDHRIVKGYAVPGWQNLANWLTLDTSIDLMRLNFPYLRDYLPVFAPASKK